MTLVLRKPPEDEPQLISSLELSLGDPLPADAGPAAMRTAEIAAEEAHLEVTQPFPVYTASLEHLESGRFLESADITAWQYVVFQNAVPAGVAEAIQLGPAQKLQFTTRYSRRTAETLVKAVERAERESEGRELEVRLLSIPDVFVRAVWLHSEDNTEDDRLIMIAAPRSLRKLDIVDEAELVAAVKELAEQPEESADESNDESNDEFPRDDVSVSSEWSKER